MKIAVEGCAHGELDKIYEALDFLQTENNVKVDLLIICGDFQAVRNRSDLKCMAVPPKYQKLNTFYKYYSGEKKAPILTIFVGGNHEASNFLSELPYGGWVCHNIYYMGYAGVINVNGVRIAGLSGIYKGQDYLKGHFECLPYDESSKRSIYHIRNVDVFRLKQMRGDIDIFLSHDWPRGIYNYGDKEGLLRFKPFFKNEMDDNKLGSRPAEDILFHLCPTYWFAAHLHCRFSALVPHEKDGKKKLTKFLALDKCLPNRKFLQVLDIGNDISQEDLKLQYDVEWLAILRSTNHLLNITINNRYMPGPGGSEESNFNMTETELEEVKKLFDDDLVIPNNFVHTAPPEGMKYELEAYLNPQTTRLCQILNIDDPLVLLSNASPEKLKLKDNSFSEDLDITNTSQLSFNPDQSSLLDDSSDDELSPLEKSSDLDTTGSSGFFYIDTKRTKVLTSSPIDVKYSTRMCGNLENSSRSTDLSGILADFPELKELNDSNPEINPENVEADEPVKKLKRRNLALYKHEEENDK